MHQVNANFLEVSHHLYLKKINQNFDRKPQEKTGFRNGYSIMDYLHTTNQLIQKTAEYDKLLSLRFVDHEKVFDSVDHKAALISLHENQISEHITRPVFMET